MPSSRRVDLGQLRTIVAYTLRQELRSSKPRKKPGKSANPAVIINLFLYAFSGVLIAFVTGELSDLFTSTLLAASFVLAMEASFVLLEFPTLVTGPADFSFYASQPVSGPTYFAGKLIATLVVTLGFSLVFLVPYTAIRLIGGAPLLIVLAVCYAIVSAAMVATFSMVTSMLVAPRRATRLADAPSML